MIGTGLKKLANENGMKVANGLAYGTFRGYSAAFWDGSGTKTMMLSTSIPVSYTHLTLPTRMAV